MEYFGEPTQAIIEFFAASVDRLVCYTAVFSWGGALRDDTKIRL